MGFTIQAAHFIGAKQEKKARNVLQQGIVLASAVSCLFLLAGFFAHERLPVWLAAMLSKSMGLSGVWIAMCAELCVRGVLFLVRLARKSHTF